MKISYRPRKGELIFLGFVTVCVLLFLADIKRWIYLGDYVYNTYIKSKKKLKVGMAVIDPSYPWYIKKANSISIYMTSIPPRNVPFCGLVVASYSDICKLPVKNDPTYQCIDVAKSIMGKRYPVVDCKKIGESTLNIEYWCMDELNLSFDVTGMPEVCKPQFWGLLESIARSNQIQRLSK